MKRKNTKEILCQLKGFLVYHDYLNLLTDAITNKTGKGVFNLRNKMHIKNKTQFSNILPTVIFRHPLLLSPLKYLQISGLAKYAGINIHGQIHQPVVRNSLCVGELTALKQYLLRQGVL